MQPNETSGRLDILEGLSRRKRRELRVQLGEMRSLFTSPHPVPEARTLAMAPKIAETIRLVGARLDAPGLAPRSWVGGGPQPGDPVIYQYRARAAEIMAQGIALALAAPGSHPSELLTTVFRAAFSLDTASRQFGDLLTRRPLPDPLVPPDLEKLDELTREGCLGELFSGTRDVGSVLESQAEAFLNTARLTSVDNPTACGDESVQGSVKVAIRPIRPTARHRGPTPRGRVGPGQELDSSGRHARTFGANRDFDGALHDQET
jgi:hypothetical protein